MPEPARIALLGPFAPYRGGIAQFNDRLRAALEEAGHEVLAVSFSRQYPALLFPGSSQYDPSRPGDAHRWMDSINPFSWKKTGQQIRDFAPDFSLAAYWTPHLAPALAFSQRASGLPAYTLVHNALPHGGHALARPMARFMFGRSAGVITLSDSVSEEVAQVGYSGGVLTSFHPVYDHFGEPLNRAEARARLALPPEAPVLLCLGLVREYKGYERAVAALPEVRKTHPEATLIVAGEAYDDTFDAALAANPVQGVRRENRYIPDAEVPLYCAAADALLLPYRSATQSGALAVAAHFGLPAVVSDVEGLADPVRRFGMGTVCGTSQSFGEALLAQLRPDALASASEGARAMAAELSWERFAGDILTFVQGTD